MGTGSEIRKYRKGSDREDQMKLIIEKGRVIFSTEPELSMAKLAKRVGLKGASSLYRYVNSKRELWFAIVINDFTEFTDELEMIINDPNMVSYREILIRMCSYFLKFSRENFPKFKVMFLTEPPSPIPKKGEKGAHEQTHEPKGFTVYLNIVAKAQNAGEIRSDLDPFMLTGMLWSILLGASISVSPLYSYLGDDFFMINDEIMKNFGNKDVREILHHSCIDHIQDFLNK